MLLLRISSMVSVVMMILGSGFACGQDPSTGSGQVFPNKPIRIITSLPGGGSDFTARLIAQGISAPLGQPVIVENRASSVTGETAMKALPDGYTLLVEGDSSWLTPLLQKTPYDVLRDFATVTMVLKSPSILVANPSVPVNSVSELIALAKSKPGQLNYGSTGIGGSQHVAMEVLKSMAGVNIVHIPYKGSGPAMSGVVAGEVQFFIPSAATGSPFIKTGKLRVLGVTTPQPSPLFPGVPTIASAGLPGYEFVNWTGLFASGKPPKAIVGRLNQEVVRALNTKEIKDRFFSVGVETVGNTPEEFTAIIKYEVSRIGKIVKDLGIKVE